MRVSSVEIVSNSLSNSDLTDLEEETGPTDLNLLSDSTKSKLLSLALSKISTAAATSTASCTCAMVASVLVSLSTVLLM